MSNKALIIAASIATLVIISKSGGGNSFKSNYKGTTGRLPTGFPRGVRNNNPGNIRISANNTFIGRINPNYNTDGAFEQFTTYEYGVRALIITLRNYIKNGYDTIEKIISRYAPSSENNTEAYIKTVSNSMDMRAGKRIKDFDREKAFKMVSAIIAVENGGKYLSDSQFNKAWWMIL